MRKLSKLYIQNEFISIKNAMQIMSLTENQLTSPYLEKQGISLTSKYGNGKYSYSMFKYNPNNNIANFEFSNSEGKSSLHLFSDKSTFKKLCNGTQTTLVAKIGLNRTLMSE